jgi:ABC-type nitrate/sulfonate/bicarbonate transport system substrate-binding protein
MMPFSLNNSKNSFLRNPFLSALICIALIFLTSCEKETKVSGPPVKITIAYTTTSTAILVYIAFAKGYFAQEGLDATQQPHPFGKLALNAVLEGKADIAAAADTPIVFAVLNNKRITTLAVIQSSSRNEGIYAMRDRGIEKPVDLEGKRIGATLGTTSEFFADSFLLAHGTDRKKVKIIGMKPDEMAAALDAGRVDAVSAFYPTLKQLEKVFGNRGTVFFGGALYTEDYCVVAGQEYVKKQPAAIRKVLRALLRAETFVQRNPDEALRLAAEFIGVDKALLDEIWPSIRVRVALDQALLVNLEEQTRWALKKGSTVRKEMPNYLDYIYLDGLLAVKPGAVSIVR